MQTPLRMSDCSSPLSLRPGDPIRQTENRATRCKVERLQLLMQQKRLRRKARRDQRAPYQWLPNRKAGRSNSNSSMSSEGSLDLDFDDSVWKPDVKADLKSEFVMAWTIRTAGSCGMDSNGCAKRGDLPRDTFWGSGSARLCQKVSCAMRKWEIAWLLVTWNRNQGSPEDLNPILSFMADLAKSSG